jgi:hypothetical protein
MRRRDLFGLFTVGWERSCSFAVLTGFFGEIRISFLSPLRGWRLVVRLTHSLRCGLYSFAAPRLVCDGLANRMSCSPGG